LLNEALLHRNRPDLFADLAYESLWILQHQSIRNSQQPDADGPQVIFFGGVSPHLTWLRVNTTIQFDSQAMFEAVEIDDPVLDATLAAKFRARPAIA
jgi:hypothetical protein